MADFEAAVTKLLRLEGGYHPSDSTAGEVNFGITEKFLKKIGYPKRPKELTVEEAKRIYRKHFWDRYRLGEFRDQRLAEAVFACLVNASPSAVLSRLSSACKSSRPLTACARLTGERASRVLEAFKSEMLAFYRRLAESRPDLYARYLPAWTARVQSL